MKPLICKDDNDRWVMVFTSYEQMKFFERMYDQKVKQLDKLKTKVAKIEKVI